MSEQHWARTTFYAAAGTYAAMVWTFHLGGGEVVFSWLEKWQTLVGALLGGGAAILAGRYALSAVRAQVEATEQLRRDDEAKKELHSIEVLTGLLQKIWITLREAWPLFEMGHVDASGGAVGDAYERLELHALRMARSARDLHPYLMIGGDHASTISSSIIGIEMSAIRIAEEAAASLKAINGRLPLNARRLRDLKHHLYILARELVELLRATHNRGHELCEITGRNDVKLSRLIFLRKNALELIERLHPGDSI